MLYFTYKSSYHGPGSEQHSSSGDYVCEEKFANHRTI